MSHPFTTRRWQLALLLLLTASAQALADSGKELFEKQCTGCHSIGGGDGAGPDLKGVGSRRPAEWLVRVIVEPDKLAAEKEPTQTGLVKKYGSEMPNLGISRDDAQKIAAFLQGGAGPAAASEGAAAPASEEPKKETVVTKELLASGVALFSGKTLFAKGGPPCVSCHALRYPGIYGGALATDLTGMFGKMGETGVRGVLKGLSFPIMKKAYADRPLSEEEMTALTALFRDASRSLGEGGKDASQRQEMPSDPYPAAGLGFFALFIVLAIIFKRRIS
jgi:mono/diheme cytochrome c family protein